MSAFSLEPRQIAWCAELRTLAAERLRPLAEKGEPGRVNRALVAELGRLGLLERLFTSGAVDLCLMRESLAYACTEAETALALQGLGAHPVHAYGTPAQRAHWLPRVSEGTAIAAFALSEPGAGSDAGALALRADGEGRGKRKPLDGTARLAPTLRARPLSSPTAHPSPVPTAHPLPSPTAHPSPPTTHPPPTPTTPPRCSRRPLPLAAHR